MWIKVEIHRGHKNKRGLHNQSSCTLQIDGISFEVCNEKEGSVASSSHFCASLLSTGVMYICFLINTDLLNCI